MHSAADERIAAVRQRFSKAAAAEQGIERALTGADPLHHLVELLVKIQAEQPKHDTDQADDKDGRDGKSPRARNFQQPAHRFAGQFENHREHDCTKSQQYRGAQFPGEKHA